MEPVRHDDYLLRELTEARKKIAELEELFTYNFIVTRVFFVATWIGCFMTYTRC
jgi:hypothetical protein